MSRTQSDSNSPLRANAQFSYMVTRLPQQNKKRNRILNVAIVVVALISAGLLLKKFYFDRSPEYKIAPQARLSIQGVDWAQSDRTLLLALTSRCQYCSDSAAFYRRLVQQVTQQSSVRLIALFPEKQKGGEDYLTGLGLQIKDHKYVSLASLGIRSFPTLALLDRNGVVKEVWVGKLGPRMESHVMRQLRLTDSRSVDDWLIDEKKLRVRLANHEPIVLVDVREREAFAQGHRAGARNIPLDELPTRAMDELSPANTVVVYGDDEMGTDRAYSILDSQGFRKLLILDG